MNDNGQIREEQLPRAIWFIYQGLAWFWALATVISLCFRMLYVRVEYFEIYSHLPYVEHSVQLIFLISCIGAIARRSCAARWVSVTGVWYLAICWSGIPGLAERTVEEISYGPAVVIGGGPDLRSLPYPAYVYLLAKLIRLVLLLTLIITSRIVSTQQPQRGREAKESGSIKTARLLYVGIIIIFVGLTFKWLDTLTDVQVYAMTIGSYLMVAGAVLVLIWHIPAQEFFIAASVASTSAILFLHTPAIVPAFCNFLLWLPPIVIGVLNVFRRDLEAKLRLVVLGLPIVFILISFSGSVIEIPLYMRFGPYHKETSQRPADFREYLQVPLSATKARYQGGERPHLSFTIEDPYPATKTLNFISSNLEEAGWRKLDYDLLNPSFESSHLKGWYGPLERWFGPKVPSSGGQSHGKPCLWDADWINDRDETVKVSLRFHPSEDGETDWTTVYCNISQSPADARQLEFIKHYRLVHPEGNEPNKAEEPSEHSELF